MKKYICPKCEIPYCSLQCYQNLEKHLKCSENFYRECVEEQVRSETDASKAKTMGDILHRFHEEYDKEENDILEEDDVDSIDSDDDEPLHQRLKGINLDDPDRVWHSLTVEEKEDFKNYVKKIEIEKSIPEWTPWWKLPIRKVQEIPEDDVVPSCSNPTSIKLNDAQPDTIDPIPSMSSLTKTMPSDSVKFGLVNVIGAYVWTVQLFNGDFVESSNLLEVAFAFVSLSSFLSEDKVFASFRGAVMDVRTNALKMPDLLDGGPGLEASLEKDIYSILTGGLKEPIPVLFSSKMLPKAFVLSAISDCHRVLSAVVEKSRKLSAKRNIAAKSIQGSDLEATTLPPQSSTKSFDEVFPSNRNYQLDLKIASKSLRKLYYLLAFANQFQIL